MNDIGEGKKADAGEERGYAHRLGPQYGGQQLSHKHVEDSEGSRDTEFSNHRQAHRHPDRICCDKGRLCIGDVLLGLEFIITLQLKFLEIKERYSRECCHRLSFVRDSTESQVPR